MTALYDPHVEWAREFRYHVPGDIVQPRISGPAADHDLCLDRSARRYCFAPAEVMTVDADGSEKPLCAAHRAKYFPYS